MPRSLFEFVVPFSQVWKNSKRREPKFIVCSYKRNSSFPFGDLKIPFDRA